MHDLLKASRELSHGALLRLFPCATQVASQEPLKTALCPSGDCEATTHLSCLAADFLSSDPSQSAGLLPRGGSCKSCGSYVLWGDVIRGCYRRHQGGQAPQLEESDRDGDGIEAEVQNADPAEDLIPSIPLMPTSVKAPCPRVATSGVTKSGRPPKKTPSSAFTTKVASAVTEGDSGCENFDIRGFTDLEDSEEEMERRPPRPTPARKKK